MSKLAKVAKQHDKTWAQLNRRLISLPFDYDSLFTPQVAEFVKNKAASTGSSPGYLVPCLITTTAYVIAENCLIRCGPQEMPANLFMVFVGPPGTGKSQVLKEGALKPIHELQTERDLSNCIIEKCTSSALVKTIADLKKAYVLSPEVYDVLNKLLKSDEENATGDVQILCELFSGESTSYRYATERTREIPSNVPFSILGCTQVPYAARLLCRMDQGHGFLDRFMFVFPVCLRPTTAETNAARLWLDGENVHLKEVSDIFIEMFDAHESAVTSHYTFSNDALDTLTSLKDDFIKDVNDAIQDANIPPKSKKIDLLQRVATSLHVFNFITNELLHGRKPPAPPTEISLETLQQAQRYVDYVETQKDIVMEVSFHLLNAMFIFSFGNLENLFYAFRSDELQCYLFCYFR